MGKAKLVHLSSSYFPRIGGVPAAIRSMGHHTSDVFEHHAVVRDLVRSGAKPVRYQVGADSSDPRITIHRFWSDGDLLPTEMREFLTGGFDYDVLMVHTVNPLLLQIAPLVGPRKVIVRARAKTELGGAGLLEHVDHIRATLPSIKEHYVARFGVDEGKITVIPRLVDVDVFNRSTRSSQSQGMTRLLYVGRIAPEKRVWLLAGVLAELRKRNPDSDYTLRIVGDYDHPHRDSPPLQDAIATHGVEGAVTFGVSYSVEGMAELYRRGDVLVSPSRREQFCQVFLEALASGLAVVTTADGGAREWAQDYVDFTSTPERVGEMVDLVEDARPPLGPEWVYEEFVCQYSWQARKAEFVEMVEGVL